MKRFIHTGLWNILLNSDHRNTGFNQADADAALNEFTGDLQCYCREEKNLAERTRTLKIAVSELDAIKESHPFYESEEKRACSYHNRQGDSLLGLRTGHRKNGIRASSKPYCLCS